MALFRKNKETIERGVWARPGMNVTFRAEIMPSTLSAERTFKVKDVLPNGRIHLHDFPGEHSEIEFEKVK